jgi:hypothetical protein
MISWTFVVICAALIAALSAANADADTIRKNGGWWPTALRSFAISAIVIGAVQFFGSPPAGGGCGALDIEVGQPDF